MNGTLLQSFHWYSEGNGQFWKSLKDKAEDLQLKGITAVWLPPPYKGADGAVAIGYDVYDIFDLGEFDQKGTIPTKYGSKDDFLQAIDALHQQGIAIYIDAVLNHKMGGDELEDVKLVRMDENNREQKIGEAFMGKAYTKFLFPGRDKKYSDFVWDFQCFSGIDFAVDQDGNEITGLFSILNQYGDSWEENVSEEHANYDYLMGDDIDFRNPAVRQHLKDWIKWMQELTKFDGVRLDAVKHINADFFIEWIDFIKSDIKSDSFFVGEYWTYDHPELVAYIDSTGARMHLFDAPLQNNFHTASREKSAYNLTEIFNNTLVQSNPENAVTLVANHDTQPLQSLENPVEPWFKPLAYALILMRADGYPCVFAPDIYGAHYKDKGNDGSDAEVFLPVIDNLNALMTARQSFAYGEQIDFFDHPNCIAWRRTGDADHEGAIIILSNGENGFKEIELGSEFSNTVFYDFLGNVEEEVTLDENGKGTFLVNSASVSVWVRKN
ncbi:MAG: alpha-amylase [Pseudopedobacter saltans]|uniref:Alpha-amylase n=1 Tax=Pseudopedobacter saltans TaxID=151895 RepID=A0A2W5FEH5_9SPHI|nr:MAG: alpha-amylase [Pseudopedobacter saltans]